MWNGQLIPPLPKIVEECLRVRRTGDPRRDKPPLRLLRTTEDRKKGVTQLLQQTMCLHVAKVEFATDQESHTSYILVHGCRNLYTR